MNFEASWQTMIKIDRTKAGGTANSNFKMNPEDLTKDGQSNTAGEHPLTDHLPAEILPCCGSLSKAEIWKKENNFLIIYTHQ